jgi:hypothetical protein
MMLPALFSRSAVNDVLAQHEHFKLSTRIMAKSVRRRHKVQLDAASQREVELTRLWQKIEALEGFPSVDPANVTKDAELRAESLALSELEHRKDLQKLFVKLNVLNEAIVIVQHRIRLTAKRKRRVRHSRYRARMTRRD